MRRQIIFSALFIFAIGGIVAAIIWGPDGDWDRGRDDRVEIVRVADDGSAGSGDVIVVEGQRPFFFPFGLLLVPLAFFLLFGLFRGVFFGGGGPRWGPNRFATRDPAWLEEWHRRQHADGQQSDDATRPQA